MANLKDADGYVNDGSGYAPADLAGKPVDLSIFEMSAGCGTCHPGGGPLELAFDGSRHDTRDSAALGWPADNGWDNKSDHTKAPWAAKGVLENDCFLCHLKGYNHLGRNVTTKLNKDFRKGPTVGAALGADNGDGTFAYDTTRTKVVQYDDGGVVKDVLALADSVLLDLRAQPEDANCGICHMPSQPGGGPNAGPGFLNVPPVTADGQPGSATNPNILDGGPKSDWAKRGFFWNGDSTYDVHAALGCKGCHMGANSTGDKLKCNPGKGSDPLGSVDNGSDHTVAYCQDCHIDRTAPNTFGAPDPALAHKNAGLTSAIAGGKAHLDFVSCLTCHVKKTGVGAARVFDFATGGKYPTWAGTGPGPGGFEPAHTWKVDPADGKYKLYPFNYLTALIWNNVGATDVNGDGETGDVAASKGGFDPVIQDKYVKPLFDFTGLNGKGEAIPKGLIDNSVVAAFAKKGPKGNVMITTGAEVDEVGAQLEAALAVDPKIGGTPRVELALASEPFGLLHNIVSTTTHALGKRREVDVDGDSITDTSYGCVDCHNGSTFFNGDYDMLEKDIAGNYLSIASGTSTPVVAHAGYHDEAGNSLKLDYIQNGTTRKVKRYETMGFSAGYATGTLAAITGVNMGVGAEIIVAAFVPATDLQDATLLKQSGNRIYVKRSGANPAFTVRVSAKDDVNFDGTKEQMFLGSTNTAATGLDAPTYGTGQNIAITGGLTGGVKYVYVTVKDAEEIESKQLAYILYVY